jgi:methionine-gamma-lyase
MGARQVELWKQQCTGTGSLISFRIVGGETEVFKILDGVKHIKMAVSLGGIESLIEHPWSMTHSDMIADEKKHAGITENLIRLSVGLEDANDLIEDLCQALATV